VSPENTDQRVSRRQLIEYALIVGLITLTAFVIIVVFSSQLGNVLAWIASEIHNN